MSEEDNKPSDDEFRKRIQAEKELQDDVNSDEPKSWPADEEETISKPDEEVKDPFEVDSEQANKLRDAEITESEEDPDDTVEEGVGLLRWLADQTNISPEEIETVAVEGLERYDDEERQIILNDRRRFLTRLLTLRNTALSNRNSTFMNECLKEIKESGKRVEAVCDQVFKDKLSRGSGYQGAQHGANAAVAFRARMQGLRKIYLHNSGFHVVLRPFTNAELNEFFVTCDQDQMELGHILGGHFYLVHDLFIKKKFMDLLPLAIVSSNLKDWRRNDVLNKNISTHDYDTLVWAVCSLMYKKGIQHDHVCGNTDCRHVTKNIHMDMQRMRLVNMNIFPEAAVEFLMAEKKNVTSKELQQYRDELLDSEHTFTLRDLKFKLKLPTIHDYFEYATKLYKTITAKAQGPKTIANNVIITNIMLNYNRPYVPWIKTVSMIDEHGKTILHTDDVEGIHAALDELGSNEGDEELDIQIRKFMKSTRISFIGYHSDSCQKCGQSNPDAVDGLMAWDVQSLFFSLTYRKLEPVGIV